MSAVPSFSEISFKKYADKKTYLPNVSHRCLIHAPVSVGNIFLNDVSQTPVSDIFYMSQSDVCKMSIVHLKGYEIHVALSRQYNMLICREFKV